MEVQWLRLCAFTPEDLGSIPGVGTKMLQAVQCGQKGKKRKEKTVLFDEAVALSQSSYFIFIWGNTA